MNAANTDARRPAHWGLGATIAMTAFIAIIFFFLQFVVASLWARLAGHVLSRDEVDKLLSAGANNGTLIAIASIVSTIACSALVVAVVKLKQGSDVREYLSLKTVPMRTVLRWVLPLAVVLVLFDVLSVSLGRPIVPEFMQVAYATADPVWLLWAALVVAAPVFEEVFIRGFVLKGLQATFLRPAGAVLVTAALWTVMHTQYDAYNLVFTFLLGVMFATARIATDSLLVPLALHMLTNLGATIETALLY